MRQCLLFKEDTMFAKDMLKWWRDFFKGNFLMLQSMAFSRTPKLNFPIDNYQVSGDGFLKDCTFDRVHWGFHLGEDSNVPAGTKVKAIGIGRVVYSAPHLGKIEKEKSAIKLHRNWGNIIVIAHKNPKTGKIFCSIYGHLQKRFKKKGISIGHIQVLLGHSDIQTTSRHYLGILSDDEAKQAHEKGMNMDNWL